MAFPIYSPNERAVRVKLRQQRYREGHREELLIKAKKYPGRHRRYRPEVDGVRHQEWVERNRSHVQAYQREWEFTNHNQRFNRLFSIEKFHQSISDMTACPPDVMMMVKEDWKDSLKRI